MERRTAALSLIAVVLALLGGAGAAAPARAADFKDAAAVWQKVLAQTKDLRGTIQSRKLGQVHEIAFEIRDLVRELPDKSKGLRPDRQKKLAGFVKQVDRLAKQLDESGDSRNLKATQTHQQALHHVLRDIEKLYPPGALGHAAHGQAHGKK